MSQPVCANAYKLQAIIDAETHLATIAVLWRNGKVQ